MILGLDQGYFDYKTSKGVKFASRYKRGRDIDINKPIFMNLDNNDYTIGETGEFTLDVNKIDTNLQRVLTLAAIALSSQDKNVEVDIVAGLPVALYKDQAAKLNKSLTNLGKQYFELNGASRSVTIKSSKIFPQAAGLIFTDPKYKNIDTVTIDWGGYTVDVCYFEGLKLKHYNSYFMGCIPLFMKLAKMINSQHGLNFAPLQIPKVLEKGLKVDGVRQDLKPIVQEVKSHISEVMTLIKSEFPVRTVDTVSAFGGGSILFRPNIETHIKNIEFQENAVFTNAKAFELIGRLNK